MPKAFRWYTNKSVTSDYFLNYTNNVKQHDTIIKCSQILKYKDFLKIVQKQSNYREFFSETKF